MNKRRGTGKQNTDCGSGRRIQHSLARDVASVHVLRGRLPARPACLFANFLARDRDYGEVSKGLRSRVMTCRSQEKCTARMQTF